MPDQTYVSVPSLPFSNAPSGIKTIESDQVTGIPTQAIEVKSKEILTELGGTGTAIVSGFLTNQDYNTDFTGVKRIVIYGKMRLSDSTVRAGLNMVKLPLLSADWYIKEPSGNETKSPVTDFIDRQLFKNPSFSWTPLLR